MGARPRFDGMPPPMREDPPLPTEPPFTAFVVNLSFDSTEGDVAYFFEPLKPISVRLVTAHDGRPKGYGYVEFETLDQLKEALTYSGKPLDNRNVRVSVAESPSRGGRSSAVADDASQWRRSTPLPPRGGFEPGVSPTLDPARRLPRAGFEPPEPSVSDVASDWRTGKPVVGRGPRSGSGEGFGSRFPRRAGHDEGSPMDDDRLAAWRQGKTGGGGVSHERKKLQLKPRGTTPASEVTATSSSGSSRPNPFGDAKPVNVLDREREIQAKIEEKDRHIREELQKKDERKKAHGHHKPRGHGHKEGAQKPAHAEGGVTESAGAEDAAPQEAGAPAAETAAQPAESS